jgi:hypothetical protein
MSRAAVSALLAILCVAASSSRQPRVAFVLLLDVTATVSEAMAMPQAPAPGGEGRPIAKLPNSPRDIFLRPVQHGFIGELATNDRVMVGAIARSVRLPHTFASDRDLIQRMLASALSVEEADRYGPSPLWDGIEAAISALEQESRPRHVLLVTDGLSTGNGRSLQSVIERAVQSNVSISVICESWGTPRSIRYGWYRVSDRTGNGWRRLTFGDPLGNLRRLTTFTGGTLVVDGESGQDPQLQRSLAELVRRLRSGSS